MQNHRSCEGRSHDIRVTDWEKETQSDKYDFKKNTNMSSYVFFEIRNVYRNSTYVKRRKEKNRHWCANFKLGKFWKSLSLCIDIFEFRN